MIRNLISRFIGGGTRTRTTTTPARGTTASGGIGARVGAAVERLVRRR